MDNRLSHHQRLLDQYVQTRVDTKIRLKIGHKNKHSVRLLTKKIKRERRRIKRLSAKV